MEVIVKESKEIELGEVLHLYKSNRWSAAYKPKALMNALKNSHTLVSARLKTNELIGLGNAISDGHLVVYFPHLLVLPEYHCKGIGRMIMNKLQDKYADFHQQILVSQANSTGFYEKCGFSKADECLAMWVYERDGKIRFE
jgi:GNAT superfamily N-acetyltransferase